MPTLTADSAGKTARSLHVLGVMSGLTAGAWLGTAEAPTKFVTAGLSPFLISLAMVAGVFVARWTVPTALKGTQYIWLDLREKPHLIAWAVIAGALWAVANTLTVFAIRDVGLSIAFPLWNTNSLIGLLWGCLLFRELRGAGLGGWSKVAGGAVAILLGAILLAYAASAHHAASAPHRATAGIIAAISAGLLWGTMYIPYKKAYLSGMNPLSFVTVFTIGELITMTTLALVFMGGPGPLLDAIALAKPVLFWLFLGGFFWVLGDLFQQFAAKYIGISRGIPLSNTNQLWGLAWGVLVFGELAGQGNMTRLLVICGSLIMILGAVAISSAVASSAEQSSWREAAMSECKRYGLDFKRVAATQAGEDPLAAEATGFRWWDGAILAAAVGVFVVLAFWAERPPIAMERGWTAVLVTATMTLLVVCGRMLWKRTRFS
ncbi:MAG: GRP family sugar transporter [bacterium]